MQSDPDEFRPGIPHFYPQLQIATVPAFRMACHTHGSHVRELYRVADYVCDDLSHAMLITYDKVRDFRIQIQTDPD